MDEEDVGPLPDRDVVDVAPPEAEVADSDDGADAHASDEESIENEDEDDIVVTSDQLVRMSPEELSDAFALAYEQWTTMDLTSDTIITAAMNNICRTTNIETLTPDAVQKACDLTLQGMNYMGKLMEEHGLINTTTQDGLQRMRNLSHLKEIVAFAFGAVQASVMLRYRVMHPQQPLDVANAETLPWVFSAEREAKLRPQQILLLYLLNRAQMLNLRRTESHVFEEIFLENGDSTHAWRPLCTMEEYVHRSIDKETHWELWRMLTEEKGRARWLAEHLTKCEDKEFPRLNKQRRYHSFRNGVYDVDTDTFMVWRDPRLTGDIVACNFHDVDMPEYIHTPEFKANPRLIPTPALDTIFEQQDIPSGGDVYVWALAWILGRCLYRMGQLERNQRNGVFIIGHAGSGKSSIANLVRDFYDVTDTGALNSECEPKYALAHLFDKKIWFCTEVKRNFQLDVAMLQQMLEGGVRIPIQKKNVTAFAVVWDIPGIMCGNELPMKWIDVGNALLRRFLIFEFPNKPEHSDPMLEAKLRAEMGLTMVKANRMYRMVVEQMAGDSIDTHLPAYFHEKLDKFQRKTQPFVAMLDDHPELTKDEHAKMLLVELKAIFNEYCKLNNLRSIGLDDDEIVRQLKAKGLEVRLIPKDAPVEYNGREQHGTFVFGIGKRDDLAGGPHFDRESVPGLEGFAA